MASEGLSWRFEHDQADEGGDGQARHRLVIFDSQAAQLNQLPWKDEALPIIKNLQVSDKVIAGFKKVDEYESAPASRRATIQFDHLMRIAEHEQGVILQPLIYENKDFADWIQVQRSSWVNWATPPVELIFTHACVEPNQDIKSVAPKGTELEVLESRMGWIEKAARKFHGLMQMKKSFMEHEIATMAGWIDLPDDPTLVQKSGDLAQQLGRKINNLRNTSSK